MGAVGDLEVPVVSGISHWKEHRDQEGDRGHLQAELDRQGQGAQDPSQGVSGWFVTTTRYSAVTSAVQPGMVGATPKITGTPTVNQELTADEGTWGSRRGHVQLPVVKRPSGRVCRITGATKGIYQIEGRYVGYKLKVQVTGSATDYAPLTRSSRYTSIIT
jgi:hypothetical protein